MARIRSVHVSEHQLRGRAREIIFEFRRDERSPAGLRVQFVKLRARSCAKHVAHADRPDSSRDASERDVFRVEAAIEKERETRPELIDRNSASSEHLCVSKSIRKRVSSLLHRRRTGFPNVITTDRDRIPARHFARGKFDQISEKTQRRLNRKDRLVLCLNFLENVGLNRAAKF